MTSKKALQYAVSFAQYKLGDNFADVLKVADNISDGKLPQTFQTEVIGGFGGVEAITSVIEESVSAKKWRDAQKMKAEVLRLWALAEGDDLADIADMQSMTNEQRGKVFSDLFSSLGKNLQSDDMSQAVSKLKDIDAELKHPDTTEYRRNELKRQKQKLTDKSNQQMMASQRDKARQQDAKELTALIVILGKNCVSDTDIYDAIMNVDDGITTHGHLLADNDTDTL